MEEVPAHVHSGPIVPDILSRQHEHRSGLIWSGDHEMCFTDLQCRRFGHNLFSATVRLPAVVHGNFGGRTTDRGSLSLSTDLGVVMYTCITALADYGCSGRPSCSSLRYMCTSFDYIQLPTQTLVTYRDQLDFMPSDQIVEYNYPGRVMRQFARAQYIPDACDTRLDLHRIQLRGVTTVTGGHSMLAIWYWGITGVYIDNPANYNTRSHGYQPAGVDKWMMTSMLQEVDDMASVLIQEPPSSPSQMVVFAKKVQTIISELSNRRPREHVPDRGARGVKRGAHRQPGRGVGGGRPLAAFSRQTRTCRPWACKGGEGFRAPPPPSIAGSSTPHQPISQTSSSDEEERTDDMDVVQHYGFRDRIGKKTTRFRPSDWPLL
ncbi:hypothetical protein M9H77_20921 [Catharanthus roseus]|uniref:Uncharacterized protein n=1 Tax=Catharanthus roseus TaxID=4058 RepID=A0ACC0AQ86_CATRO|nr:hypothetical protein M9H77_20921 [Catharanthus roseus]